MEVSHFHELIYPNCLSLANFFLLLSRLLTQMQIINVTPSQAFYSDDLETQTLACSVCNLEYWRTFYNKCFFCEETKRTSVQTSSHAYIYGVHVKRHSTTVLIILTGGVGWHWTKNFLWTFYRSKFSTDAKN